MNPWKIALPALLLGVLVGGVGGAWVQRRAFMRPPDTQRVLARLTRRLSLDEGQQTAVRAVLEERRAKMTALREETLAKSRQIKAEMRDAVKKALRPDQLKKYEEMLSRADARFKKDRKEVP